MYEELSSIQWNEQSFSKYGTRILARTLDLDPREKLKNEFRVPELEEIQSSFSGNFRLFQVKNLEKAKGVIFIEPKVYIHGTAQGGNVLSVSSHQGRSLTLTIPISFVDGLKPILPSYSGGVGIPLPEALRIPDPQLLKADLSAALGVEVSLSALLSCPSELSLYCMQGAKSERLVLRPTIPLVYNVAQDQLRKALKAAK